MRNPRRLLFLAASVVLAAAAAPPPSKTITLALKPAAKGQAPPAIDAVYTGAPLKLDVVDVRTALDAQIVGKQTEKGNTVYVWRSDAPVGPAAGRFLSEILHGWSVPVDAGAGRSLSVHLEKYEVVETSAQIGSVYHGDVALSTSLAGADGTVLALGHGEGTAKKQGPDIRASMANEVLSNALRDALAQALAPGAPAAAAPAAQAAAPVAAAAASSAQTLLDELIKMKASGVGDGILVSYVKKQSLQAPLTAADITRWKESGMTDAVIQAAMDLK